MLKYKSILEKLTRRQKIALVTDPDALIDAAINRAGVPEVRRADLLSLAEARGISLYSLANSWDVGLVEEVAEDVAAEARGRGCKLLTTPDLATAVSAYREGLSEDPYLNGALGGAMIRAIRSAGAAAEAAKFAVGKGDAEYLDVRADLRAVHDLIVKPFLYAAETSPCDAVCASLDRVRDGYQTVNASLFGDAAEGRLGEDILVSCEPGSALPDFHAYLDGCVCIGGGDVRLERALGRYEQLKADWDNGSATALEFRNAVEAGLAIGEETLDEAADRVIDFAFRVNRIPPLSRSVREGLALRAARESIVLLKNEGTLPLAEGTKVSVIGDDFGFTEACSALEVVSHTSKSADAADNRAIGEAVRAAAGAKTAIVFFRSEERDRLRLSPDSLALIDALSGTKRRLVAVLLGDFPADFSFDLPFSAVLSAPRGSAPCAKAIEEVLTGKYNPSGRLARSGIDDADEYYTALKNDKDYGRTKVGSFVGYRYYDTAGRKVRYPFGHGLSYTSFTYSKLELGEGEVSFTVANTGDRAGVETAQVYVGLPKGGRLRPAKELKGFTRVDLAAGESKQVSVPLPRSLLASFDAATRTERVEKGVYSVYVGSSVSDIRLKAAFDSDGETCEEPAERPGEYFRDFSQIGKNFRLGAAAGGSSLPAKAKTFRILSAGVLLLSLLIAVIAGLVLLQSDEPTVGEMIFLLVDLFVALCSAVALIGEKGFRKRKLRAEIALQKLNFPEANMVSTPSEVFDAAFAKQEAKEERTGDSDEPHYFDKAFTFEVIARELQLYAAERGILLTEKGIHAWIAAMAASRLVIVSPKSEKQLNLFAGILGEYFGTTLFAENAEKYPTADGFFRRGDWRTPGAEEDKSRIRICLLRHVGREWLERLAEIRYNLPPNLVLVLEMGELPASFPPRVAENASVLSFEAREAPAAREKTAVRPLGNYQFENLCRIVREDFPLDERLWKRVDRLEEACGGEGVYRIPNRLWIGMERFSSAFIACGGESAEALDGALAAELLPTVLERLRAGRTDEEILSLLEEIFGGEHIEECRTLIRLTEKKEATGGEES